MISLHHGSMLDVLKTLPENSVDSCCTDPPYHLTSVVKRFGGTNPAPAQFGTDGAFVRASRGFMQKERDGGDIAFRPETWAEVYRVLKPGAFVAAFGASRGYHRMACAIEDAGFEIRDSLMWVYGTGFPKSQNVAKFIDAQLGVDGEKTATGAAVKRMIPGADQNADGWIKDDGREFVPHSYTPGSPQAQEFDGFGTALKPAFEPIVLARKPLSEGTVAANVLRWRTGALNIDASRVGLAEGETPYSYPNGAGGNTFSIAKGVDGTRTEPTAGNDKGRWPANVVHDGSDEVVGAFPSTEAAHVSQRGLQHSGRHGGLADLGDNLKEGTNSKRGFVESGRPSAARFFYSAKASKADRAGSKHPTVKPISLMEWLATLITPPGGTVLDPFAGSGTTGAACRNKGFNCVLVEREDEYAADIKRRLDLPGAVPLDPNAPTTAGRRIYGIFADEKGVAGGRLDTTDPLDTMLARYRAQRAALACL